MVLLKVISVKEFMGLLFSKNLFDDFMLHEADIVTNCRFRIEGGRCPAFYDTQELEDTSYPKYCTWAEKKALVFEGIKGKKLPVSMKLVFQAPEELVKKELGKADGTTGRSFYFNLRFEGKQLSVITGSACNVFSLDRTPDEVWDKYVAGMLSRENIEYEREA